jgi:ubiquinone/menaquinone biosynthesis C-methylase UbiE
MTEGAMLGQWYDETVLPKLVKLGCSSEKVMELRGHVVPRAEGQVFELGCGGGLNQPFYDPARVTSFAGIDPNSALLADARKAAQANGWEADIRQGTGEAIPFPDGSFDTVVCTYTMCSVIDQAQVLRELRRVLKPEGELLFLEHGRAPDAGPAKWQRRIEPIWKRLMGNCHLTRDVSSAMARSGFSLDQTEHRYLEQMPRWASYMEWGVARKTP